MHLHVRFPFRSLSVRSGWHLVAMGGIRVPVFALHAMRRATPLNTALFWVSALKMRVTHAR